MPPWVPMGPTEEQMSSAPLKLILTSLSRSSLRLSSPHEPTVSPLALLLGRTQHTLRTSFLFFRQHVGARGSYIAALPGSYLAACMLTPPSPKWTRVLTPPSAPSTTF